MKCEQCGTIYPSIYYFQEDGRLTPLICTICFDALPNEEKLALQRQAQQVAEAKAEKSRPLNSFVTSSLKWGLLSLLGAWLVLIMFVNFSQSMIAQKTAHHLAPLLPVFLGQSFILQDERLIDRYLEPGEGEIRISSIPGEGSRLEGNITFRMGPDGQLRPVIWAHGVKHTWIGRNEVQDHIFEGDPGWPLVFRVDKDKGYVYLRGRGTVTTPDGRVIRLPR
ncbi:MAG: hypothetical protein LAO31_06710 [Acidobacteriia bacterium]|nr:hypothetical protein [Terriglobia bacterium]